MLPMIYAGTPKEERLEKAKKYLIIVGLEDRMEYSSNQLSGGQQQRVAIARALVMNQAILLADEPTAGEIIGADEKSITVKLQDGSSKIVLLSEKTQINKAEKATKEDLKKGEKVAVFGTENPDGSVTAQNIQLNPQREVIRNN